MTSEAFLRLQTELEGGVRYVNLTSFGAERRAR